MSSVLGFIDAHTERKGFFVLTFGAKIDTRRSAMGCFEERRKIRCLEERGKDQRNLTSKRKLRKIMISRI